jgi:hypothetical protein
MESRRKTCRKNQQILLIFWDFHLNNSRSTSVAIGLTRRGNQRKINSCEIA